MKNSLWVIAILFLTFLPAKAGDSANSNVVDASTLRHKVMCGYQGWFNTAGDGTNLGWIHWSQGNVLTPKTVHVEYWPDLSEYTQEERYPVPGFTYPDGSPAELYSAHNPRTVLRHFEWMRDYGIDGVWLQRFVVGLPGGPVVKRYPALLDVLHNVRDAASQTGRVWALSYDIAQMPTGKIYDALISDWKKMVDEKITADPRYVHEGGLPVVQIWGFYYHNDNNGMTAEVANKLIDFFETPGPYQALLVGGGDWTWRTNPDPEWQKVFHRFKVYVPWNVGNYSIDKTGVSRASMGSWKKDKQQCDSQGTLWIPVVFPAVSCNNLKHEPWGKHTTPRRGGNFLWEQFHTLSTMGGIDTVYLAMFDEMDEGTAILKVTNTPPTQAHFLTYEGLPSDWYMRLVGTGEKMLRDKTPIPEKIPIKP